MAKETQAGRNDWRGCHSFADIICDGDVETQTNQNKRDGCLKMKGRYWYYYQIDNLLDWSDPTQPETTSCPILPGQTVNILDVPFEKPCDPAITQIEDDSVPFRFTLDPCDRYVNPIRPQTPTSQSKPSHEPHAPSMPSRAPPPPPASTEYMNAPTRAPPLPPSQPAPQPNFWTAYTDIPSSRPISSHSAHDLRTTDLEKWWDDTAFLRPFTADDSLAREIRDFFPPFSPQPQPQDRPSNRNSVPGLTATPSTISPLTDRGASQFPFTPLCSLDTSPLKTQQTTASFSTDPAPQNDIKFINPLRSNPIDKAQIAKLAPKHLYDADDDSDNEYTYPYVSSRAHDRHVRVETDIAPEIEIELRDCVRRLVRLVLRSEDAKLGDGQVEIDFHGGFADSEGEVESGNELVDEIGWLSGLIN